MSATEPIANGLLDALFRQQVFAFPNQIWLALMKVVSGSIVEMNGGSYARVQVTSAFGDPADNGELRNTVAVTFAAATADWGTTTHVAVFDASTGGAKWFQTPLPNPRTILDGDIVRFDIGELILRMPVASETP
jgi:hypothetical protein